MTNLKNGLYRIYWKTGGFSLASIGTLSDGKSWFSPTNWTSKNTKGICSTDWDLVSYVEYIDITLLENKKIIFKYEVNLYSNSLLGKFQKKKEPEFIIDMYPILKENYKYLVLDNDVFTKIEKDGDNRFYPCLNKYKIFHRTTETILDNGVFYTGYFDKKQSNTKIKNQLKKYILKNFAYLFNNEILEQIDWSK